MSKPAIKSNGSLRASTKPPHAGHRRPSKNATKSTSRGPGKTA